MTPAIDGLGDLERRWARRSLFRWRATAFAVLAAKSKAPARRRMVTPGGR